MKNDIGINKGLSCGKKHYNKQARKVTLLAKKEGGTGAQLAVGLELKGSGGYQYFGATNNLPGVKELLARHAAKLTKRKRGDIYKHISPDYYGLRDETDAVWLELEGEMAAEQKKKLKQCCEEYEKKRTSKGHRYEDY